MTAQEELDKVILAYQDGKTYSYKGKNYSITKIRDELIPLLQGLAKEQEGRLASRVKSEQAKTATAEQVKNQTKLAIERAKEQKKIAEFSINLVKDKFSLGEITEQEYITAVNLPAKIDADIKAMESGALQGKMSGFNSYEIIGQKPTVSAAAAKEGGIKNTPTTKTIDSVETIVENGNNVEVTTYNDKTSTRKILGKAPEGTEDTPASDVFKTTAITKESAASRKQYVDEQLKAQGLTDTPENRATLRKDYQTKQIAAPTDWEADLRTYMPAKTWMLELDRTKYPQLFDLLQRASDQNYYSTPEGQRRFLGELDGTDYFKEIADSSQRRDIKKLVGDLGFDSTDFSKFVTDSINFGWEGETLKAKTYEEVFRKNVDGTYANPTAVTRATKSNDYLNKELIAKSYFNQAPQATIEKILTGGITVEDFQRQQRTMAKQRYGHLSELIDQGVTLEDLASNYKTSAAKLLEIDPNTIDMSESDFEIALSYGEEGKKRAMTTGEWEKMLRTDQRYGWEKTNNAKAEARSLASNIAQAFGRII